MSIYRAHLDTGKKIRCYCMLLSWIRMYYWKMARDLLIAADQALYYLQVAKAASTDLKQEVGAREEKQS